MSGPDGRGLAGRWFIRWLVTFAVTPQVEKCPTPSSSHLGLDEGAEAPYSVGVGWSPTWRREGPSSWEQEGVRLDPGAGAGMRWCHDPETPQPWGRGEPRAHTHPRSTQSHHLLLQLLASRPRPCTRCVPSTSQPSAGGRADHRGLSQERQMGSEGSSHLPKGAWWSHGGMHFRGHTFQAASSGWRWEG